MKLMDLLFGRVIDRRIAEYQNDLIKKHCDEVQNIYKTMRGWRHDYHNHIQTLLALADDEEKTRKYLLDLNADLTCVDTVIKTGNVMVDAILNSKLSLVRSKGIEVNARAVVPSDLQISEIDLCVIIGNLLDNALEACVAQSQGHIEGSALCDGLKFGERPGQERGEDLSLHQEQRRPWVRTDAGGSDCKKI